MWRKGTPSSNPGRSSPDQRPTQFPPYQRRTGGTARNRGGGHGRGWPTRQSEPELPSIAPLHNVRMNTKPSGRYSSRIIHDEVLPSAISRITTAVWLQREIAFDSSLVVPDCRLEQTLLGGTHHHGLDSVTRQRPSRVPNHGGNGAVASLSLSRFGLWRVCEIGGTDATQEFIGVGWASSRPVLQLGGWDSSAMRAESGNGRCNGEDAALTWAHPPVTERKRSTHQRGITGLWREWAGQDG
jgi:hypothetical protein